MLTYRSDGQLHAGEFSRRGVRNLASGGGAGYGSGHGCAISDGRPVVDDAGYFTDQGSDYEWSVSYYYLGGSTLETVGGAGGFRSDGQAAEWETKLGANGCTGAPLDIGPIPTGAHVPMLRSPTSSAPSVGTHQLVQ